MIMAASCVDMSPYRTCGCFSDHTPLFKYEQHGFPLRKYFILVALGAALAAWIYGTKNKYCNVFKATENRTDLPLPQFQC